MKKQGKFLRVAALAACLCMMLGLLTGCPLVGDGGADTPIDLAIVWGACANGPRIPVENPALEEQIYESCLSYASVSVVVPQGEPFCAADCTISPPKKSGLSGEKLREIARQNAAKIQAILASTVATGEERDLLRGIELAARTLRGGEEHEKVLVILDTGLSTSGVLNFADHELLDADPERVVQGVKDACAIPDLSGIRVVWFFLGDTFYPQQEPSASEKASLKAIWTGVLREGNAASVEFNEDPPPAVGYEGLPSVKLVTVHPDTIDIGKEPLKLGEDKLSFLGDQAVFVDPDAAVSALVPVADHMRNVPNARILLAGTTASGRREYCQELSARRAQAVKSALVSMGVSEDRIEAVGLGCENPWHVDDLTADGKLNSRAAENRSVWVLDAESQLAREILGW